MSPLQTVPRHNSLRDFIWRRKSYHLNLALALALALLPCTAGRSALAGGPVSKFVSDGDYVRAFALTATGYVFLDVTRGGTQQNPQTSLFYAVVQYYPPLFYSQRGFGLIPNSAFKVTGSKATLNLDTSLLPDFENTVCTPDENTCTPGIGGVITAEWTKTSSYSSKSTGTYEFSFGNTTMRSVGSFRETSASAQGIALGTPFQATEFAGIGTNHQVQLTIERGN